MALGLEILSKLCLLDENEDMLTDSLEESLYADIVRLMNVFDIQIIVYSLEALYQLSELGEHTTTKIAAVKHAVGKCISVLVAGHVSSTYALSKKIQFVRSDLKWGLILSKWRWAENTVRIISAFSIKLVAVICIEKSMFISYADCLL